MPHLHPTETDVLCGKSQAFLKHPGNLRFSAAIEQCHENYRKAESRKDRMEISQAIIRHLKDCGARFIRPKSGGGWEELSEGLIRDKVSHALRFYSSKKFKQQQIIANTMANIPDGGMSDAPDAVMSDTQSLQTSPVILDLKSSLTAQQQRHGGDEDSESGFGSKGPFDTLRSDDLNQIMASVSKMEGTEYSIVKEHF